MVDWQELDIHQASKRLSIARRRRARVILVGLRPERIAEQFYDELFMRAPALRQLFPDDLEEQRTKLAKTISLLVSDDRTEEIVIALQRLGRRHEEKGVRRESYLVVQKSLLQALSDLSACKWTSELEAEWRELLGAAAAIMQGWGVQRRPRSR